MIAHFEVGHAFSDRFYNACGFMTQNAREETYTNCFQISEKMIKIQNAPTKHNFDFGI